MRGPQQTLFALTLILTESEEAWPLLIDQPHGEPDLSVGLGLDAAHAAAGLITHKETGPKRGGRSITTYATQPRIAQQPQLDG